jgi:nucleoside-diphosphate-sugar epimerase
MRFLVLGSSGQIGSALTPFLQSKGHQVIPFDIEIKESQDLRIQNNSDLYALSSEVDFVIFLAFDVGGSKYLSAAQYDYGFIQNNLSIMKTVFDFIKHTGLPLIFASSQMAGMLHSSYGNLKAIGEKASISLGGSFIRFWNVYGIENDPLKSHVITDFVRQAIRNKKIEMLTDGSEIRDFLHVSDACAAILRVTEIENVGGFDVASFEYTSILDVAKIIAEITGAEVVSGSLSDSVQSGHQFDPSPEILSWWRPQVSLRDGINKVLTEIAL